MTASERIRAARAGSYLAQRVNFGGEWVTVGWLYATYGDKFAGAWLAGYRRAGNEVRP